MSAEDLAAAALGGVTKIMNTEIPALRDSISAIGGAKSPFDNWVDVKTFGALGDGVSNDTAKINAAINSLPASGGTVYIPEGTYMIYTGNPYGAVTNETCISLKNNVTIKMSENTVLKAITNAFDNYAIFLVRAVSNVTIEGGVLQGERYTHTGAEIGQVGVGVWLEGATNVTIRDVTCKEFWGIKKELDQV